MTHAPYDPDAALLRLKHASADLHAPAPSPALLAAFERRHRPSRRQRWSGLVSRVAPFAGVMTMVLAVGMALRTPDMPQQARTVAGTDKPFIAVGPLAGLADQGELTVIEARVSGLELANLGLAIGPENVGASVRTEMLVNADGQAVALRFPD